MENEKRYFRIGLFLLSGCVLIALAIIVLAGGSFFETPLYLETYFDQSVQGLDIGSPVKYRGVQIGEVKEILITAEAYHHKATNPDVFEKQCLYVMVVMSVDGDILRALNQDALPNKIQSLVDERGLRLRLEYLGITGLAYLELDFVDNPEDTPLDIYWKPKNYYIPSMSNTIQLVSQSLNDIARTLSDDFVPLMQNVREASMDLPSLSKNLDATLIALQKGLKEFGTISKGLPELEQTLTETLARVNHLLAREAVSIETTLENTRIITEDLKEIMAALKRHPSRFLFEKAPARKEVSQ